MTYEFNIYKRVNNREPFLSVGRDVAGGACGRRLWIRPPFWQRVILIGLFR